MKRCTGCGDTKPLDTFAKDKRRHDGRGSRCKECENARNRERAARLSENYTPPSTEGERTCSQCGLTKPLSEFVPRRDSPTGFYAACVQCKRASDSAAQARWRERNPDRVYEDAVAYRTANREKERERYRRYDAEHRAERREAMARSRAKNPEHHRELRRQWYYENPARARDNYYRYYQQIRLPSPETRAYIDIVLRDPCSYCGGSASHIDHIEPRSLGGTHDWTNLTASCQSCNPSKGNRPLLYWMATR